VSGVFVVKVVKTTIFQLYYISQAMKSLDISIKSKATTLLHFVDMLQNRVTNHDIFQVRAVFNYVDLFKCEQVIDDEDFVDFGLFFLILAVLPHFEVFLSSVLQFNLKMTT